MSNVFNEDFQDFIRALHLNDLIEAKKAVLRPKDQDDIENLTKQ